MELELELELELEVGVGVELELELSGVVCTGGGCGSGGVEWNGVRE